MHHSDVVYCGDSRGGSWVCRPAVAGCGAGVRPDNETGEELAVAGGGAAGDSVGISPWRREFLQRWERDTWIPEFLRERRARLQAQARKAYGDIGPRMEYFGVRSDNVIDSIVALHAERKALLSTPSDTGAGFRERLARLEQYNQLGRREILLYHQLLRLNMALHRYALELEQLQGNRAFTALEQARIREIRERLSYEISNNRRLFLMGDPFRNFLLRIYDRVNPGDESQMYQPQ